MTDPSFEALLDHIRRTRGFDFTGYKRASLGRRITRRMEEIGVRDAAEYLDYLQVHPDEFGLLFDTILINVTSFFRDAPAWEYLRKHAIPALLERKEAGDPIRVWSAATASGEEAFSLALVLADALGLEDFAERVKIYATDVDEDALAQARRGSYGAKAAAAIPADLAERFLERTDEGVTFPKELRRAVIFGRNDLVQDAPISRVDVLACRNTLMYFTAETQARILARFHFALADRGLLFLGKSETLITRRTLFTPVDLTCRIFAKVGGEARPTGSFPPLEAEDEPGSVEPGQEHVAVRDLAWDSAVVAQVAVDAEGRLALASREARTLFGLQPDDLGRRFQDLELSYKPVELRSAIDKAVGQGSPVTFPDVTFVEPDGTERRLEVAVHPLLSGSHTLGATIGFRDITAERRLRDDLERSRRELEVAYEELQSTVEELETTNEELQSTNEELETTNEELQSTNEELETMNAELQSANEELETTNEELRERTGDLNRLNLLLETIMSALGLAIVAVDEQGTVRLWNHRSEDLWGMREGEAVGHHLLSLDIGLPVEQLRGSLREALADGAGAHDVELDATDRRGRPIRLRVALRPLGSAPGPVTGAVLLMDERGAGGRPGGDGSSAG